MESASHSPQDQIIEAAATLGTAGAALPVNLRKNKRLPYEGLVAIILLQPDGTRTETMVLRAADLSSGGMSVLGSAELPTGAQGILQIVREDGQYAMLGIQIRHSRYGEAMEHTSGLQFVPLPDSFSRQEFLDENGRMKVLDPLLKQNAV